jgi:hypothetical protein
MLKRNILNRNVVNWNFLKWQCKSLSQTAPFLQTTLSTMRGTQEDMKQVQDLEEEINNLDIQIDRSMSRATYKLSHSAIIIGIGNGSELVGDGSRYRVSDGHGTWFANNTQARASAMQIEGRLKLEEASGLEGVLGQKRSHLAMLKERLTPR